MPVKNIIAKNKPKAHKTERKDDFWHIEFRSTGKFDDYRVPAWAKRVAESIRKGAEVTMGHDESAGKWQVQKVMIPVTVKSQKQAIKLAEDIACKVDYKCKIEKKEKGGINPTAKHGQHIGEKELKIKEGDKLEYYKAGALDWESMDEAEQGGLTIGDVVTVVEYDKNDHSVKVEETEADTWISAKHFRTPEGVELKRGGKAKHLKASKLLKFLEGLKNNGADLKNVYVNYRADRDSDVEVIQEVEEDLFDAKTNNILESIVLISDAREMELGGKNINSKYPELDKLASELAEEVAVKINLKIQHIQSRMPYKAQYVLEEVIKDLQKRV